MLSAVSAKAPDSGTSLPRYCSKAAAIVAAMAVASASVPARRTRVSLMLFFSRTLAQKARKKANAHGPDHLSHPHSVRLRRAEAARGRTATARHAPTADRH